MMILKECKQFVQEWKEDIKKRLEGLRSPVLGIVQVGSVEASNRYVRNKIKDSEDVGIQVALHKFNEEITTEELIAQIHEIQGGVDGLIVQLPLPDQIDVKAVTNAIDREKDVDGFRKDSPFAPCTPGGIMRYLEWCGFDVAGKDVVVIGRSNLVGKPMAEMLTAADATVTLCHSKTRDLKKYIYDADLIICAVGKPGFLNCYYLDDIPVIDVGINFVDGKICGDCYNTEFRDVTPVPGGVGLMTRAMLMENIVAAVAATKQIKNNLNLSSFGIEN